MGKLTRFVGVRLSEDEFHRLEQLAKQKHYKNFSEFIRDTLLEHNGVYSMAMKKQMHELQWEINKIGTNINQATKKINSGYGSYIDISELLSEQEEIVKLMGEYLKKVDELWR